VSLRFDEEQIDEGVVYVSRGADRSLKVRAEVKRNLACLLLIPLKGDFPGNGDDGV